MDNNIMQNRGRYDWRLDDRNNWRSNNDNNRWWGDKNTQPQNYDLIDNIGRFVNVLSPLLGNIGFSGFKNQYNNYPYQNFTSERDQFYQPMHQENFMSRGLGGRNFY